MIKFENETGILIYDDFITIWAERINTLFCSESDFEIHIITLHQLHNTYHYLEDMSKENYEDSPYGCIYDGKFENQVNNVVIVHTDLTKILDLDKNEQMACLLHEIGHLSYYLDYGNMLGNNIQWKEFISDCFVKNIGVGNDLKSALSKLAQSGLYSQEYCDNALIWRIDQLSNV